MFTSSELRNFSTSRYLQELHEPELQEEHPEDTGFSRPLIANGENLFFISLEPHSSHLASMLPKISFSNFSPHLLHVYSKIGIAPLTSRFLVIITRRLNY